MCHAVGGPRRNLTPGPCTTASGGPPGPWIVATGGPPRMDSPPRDYDVEVTYDGRSYWNTDPSIGIQLLT